MPDRTCPYLGLEDDTATRTAYPSLRNFCHRASPTQRVDLSCQESTCFSKKHTRCPVFQADWTGGLPRELRAQTRHKGLGRWAWTAFGLGLLAGLIFIAGRMGYGFPMDAWLSSSTPTPVVATLQARATAVVPSATLFPSPTPSLTDTPEHTSTPTRAPTSTLTPLPTAGPAAETRFGPQDLFLIHVVEEGESFFYLSELYDTSPEVIKATNQLLVQDNLWAGTNLLLVPGRTRVGDLPRFDVRYLDQAVEVEEVAETYQVSEEDLRYYNELDGEMILPDRWLIIPLGS